jgi:hypothetical protein
LAALIGITLGDPLWQERGAASRVTAILQKDANDLLIFSVVNFQGILEEQFGPFRRDRSGVEPQQLLRHGPKAILQFRDPLHHSRSRHLRFNHPVHIEFAWDLVYLLGDCGIVDIRS